MYSGKPEGMSRFTSGICLFGILVACTAGPERSGAVAPVATTHRADSSKDQAAVVEGHSPSSPWLINSDPPLRELTVAIHVEPPTSLATSYRSLALRYKSLRSVLLTHAEGGFGSGFVVMRRGQSDSDAGSPYFVTNQHVVGLSELVRVQWGVAPQMIAAQVVYVDENYDLAVLRLVDGVVQQFPLEAGFGFASDPARDQDVVIAAGYPGIGGEPSYQVTRGYVSNEAVSLPIDDGGQRHLQHTAPIDPGSSGGPLLNEAGKIVGMNTLKIFGREGVGLAVPASAIEAALEKVTTLDQMPDPTAASAARACESILKALQGQGVQSIERSISADWLAAEGPRSLGWLPSEEEDWGPRFFDSPEEVLLHALALRLKDTLNKRLSTEESGCFLQEGSSGGDFLLQLGKAGPVLKWKWEQARFKLAEADLLTPRPGTFLSSSTKSSKKWKPSLK